jgi:hypothetical protein
MVIWPHPSRSNAIADTNTINIAFLIFGLLLKRTSLSILCITKCTIFCLGYWQDTASELSARDGGSDPRKYEQFELMLPNNCLVCDMR